MRKMSLFIEFVFLPKIFFKYFLKRKTHCHFNLYNSLWERRCEQDEPF